MYWVFVVTTFYQELAGIILINLIIFSFNKIWVCYILSNVLVTGV